MLDNDITAAYCTVEHRYYSKPGYVLAKVDRNFRVRIPLVPTIWAVSGYVFVYYKGRYAGIWKASL